MKKINLFFDDLLKLFGAATLVLVIVGFIDLKFYYSNFSIRISEYITASEIFIRSFDKLIIILASLIIQIAIWLYLFNYLFDYDVDETQTEEIRQPRKYSDETIKRVLQSKSIRFYWAILLIGAIISQIVYHFTRTNSISQFFRDLFFINFWIGFCLYFYWILGTRKLWQSLRFKKEYDAKVVIAFIVFITILITLLWFHNRTLFVRILKYGHSEKIQLTTNKEKIIEQTDDFRYVGRTENYFFFWDKGTGKVTIYKTSDIEKIEL